MRVIALVSLALALAVSSMPLPGNDVVPPSTVGGLKHGVTQVGGKVKSAVTGAHPPKNLGSRTAPPNAGAVGAAVEAAVDAVQDHVPPSPRSVAPGKVNGEASALEGKVKSTVAHTGAHLPNGVGSRGVGGLGGAGGALGKVGQLAGGAASKGEGVTHGKGGLNKAAGAAGGAVHGGAGKLGGTA